MVDQLISDIICNVKDKMKDFFYLKDETYDKNTIDNKDVALQNQINNKSKVTFTRSLSNGTKIGTITIDNRSTDIYCEKDTNTTYTPASASPKMNGTATVGTSTKYAREDHIHPSDTNKSKVSFNRSLSSGTKIGTINIDGQNTDIYCEKNTDTTYTPASASPKMNGTATVGTSTKYAREDHIHPSDTNKSKVKFTRSLSSGTKIGTITIDGVNTDLYCEKDTNTIYTHPNFTAYTNEKLYKFTTNANGHINKATQVVKKDITDLGIPAQDTTYSPVSANGNTPGLMTPADKNKLNRQSTYRIHLATAKNLNVPTTSSLTTPRGSQIHAMTTLDGVAVVNKNIDFIINGVAYSRTTDDLGYASLNISTDFPTGNYNVIAIYRDNGWTAAIDIKTLQVT